MKSFFRRLLGKIKGSKPAPKPASTKDSAAQAAPKPKRRTDSSFEPLEGRIAPALLLNASTIQFTDVDGDLVTISFSKPIFTKSGPALNVELDAVFKFLDTNDRVRTAGDDGSAADVCELALLDLSKLMVGVNSVAKGVNVSITAKPQNGMGDDLVNVGFINGSIGTVLGTSLGNIVVDGDLGQIDAGDPNNLVGLASLTVQSLGMKGLTTQLPASPTYTPSLESNITGTLGKLTIKGDMRDATVKVIDGASDRVFGKIGSITIGGSIRVSAGNVATDASVISAASSIGAVKIGTTAEDGIFGGAGVNSAMIKSSGKIGNVTISGMIQGGTGKDSGEINGGGGIGNITIGGALNAGTGENSGRIASGGNVGAIKISVINGLDPDGAAGTADPGKNAGTIAIAGSVTSLTVTESILGGKSDGTGSVTIGGKLGKLTVGGSLEGGKGVDSARVRVGTLTSAVITERLVGGEGTNSGSLLSSGSMGNVLIKNAANASAALLAGKGNFSGAISSGGGLGAVVIQGLVDGSTASAGANSASIQALGSITSVMLTAGLKGGSAEGTGSVNAGVNLTKVTVIGDLLGGAGVSSGAIVTGGKITTATINGDLEGGTGDNSGSLVTGLDLAINGDLTKATITGGLKGNNGIGSGSLRVGGKLGTVTIGPAAGVVSTLVEGGAGGGSGSIFVEDGLTSLTINGPMQGGSGINSGAIIMSGVANKVKINGGLSGGGGEGSGSIQVKDIDLFTTFRAGTLSSLTINGAVTGGVGLGSGQILVEGSAKTITIGALTGGVGNHSGRISIGTGMAALADDFAKIGGASAITIKGALTGSAAIGSGLIEVGSRLTALTVNGTVTDAEIKSGRDIGKITINGSLESSLISAQGQVKPTTKTDLAIGSVTVKAAVSNSLIVAGNDRFGNPTNGSAQIGAINVTGNWTASSVAAGMEDVDGDGFGDADDIAIVSAPGPISKIASIVIGGQITGTDGNPNDHFGFTARQVVSVKIAGILQGVTSGVDNLPIPGSPVTNDLAIREVA